MTDSPLDLIKVICVRNCFHNSTGFYTHHLHAGKIYDGASMFLLHQPSDAQIRAFVSAQQQAEFSYGPLEVTRSSSPTGYKVDHNRILLGSGQQSFNAAVAAIKQWKMFDLDWVRLCYGHIPIEPGATVAVVVRHLGF